MSKKKNVCEDSVEYIRDAACMLSWVKEADMSIDTATGIRLDRDISERKER